MSLQFYLESYRQFLDTRFETLIDNILPFINKNYLKEIDLGVEAEYETIKKLSKLKKYKRDEFIRENNLNRIEVSLADIDVDQEQFQFFKKSIFSKEQQLKISFRNAIKKLFEVKEQMMIAIINFLVSKTLWIKSGILSDKQLVNIGIQKKTIVSTRKVSKEEIWGMKKVAKTLNYDLTKDPDYGCLAAKYEDILTFRHLLPCDQKLEFEINTYEFEQQETAQE